MRWLAAGALLLALAPAAAEAKPRTAIVFLPEQEPPIVMLRALATRPQTAIGFTSPTVGGFSPQQMALDMSQGTRIPTRLYRGSLPLLRPVRAAGGRWQLSGWDRARARAKDAPGDLVPGLLASAIERRGGHVAYAGGPGRALGAIVAADEEGRLGSASIGPPSTIAARALNRWRGADLLVADLPPGLAGRSALDRLLAARRPGDLVYVVRAPTGTALRLLPSALVGARTGRLRSATARINGLVAATDVAPTMLRRLGIGVPDPVDGQPIEPRGSANVAAVASLANRLEVVAGRRGVTLAWLGGLAALVVLGLSLLRGRAGTRAGLRLTFLAVLWAPGLMLVTAALAPSRTAEAMVIAVGSFALALATDVALRWPAGPALPALVVFLAYTVDLARGSPLIDRSLAGPNPAGGARFFGIGNELECILSVALLIGTGAAVAWSGRRSPGAFALAAVAGTVVMGAGRLGADVGAAITLGAGGAAAVVAALPGGPSRRAVALAIAAPVVAVLALIVIDLATHGGAHLTRSVLHAHGSGNLRDVFVRRVRAAYSPLGHSGKAVVFAIALAIMVALAVRRERVFAALRRTPGGVYVRAGLIGAFFAVIAGALGNDSGPLILEIGVVLLTLGAAYAAASPLLRESDA